MFPPAMKNHVKSAVKQLQPQYPMVTAAVHSKRVTFTGNFDDVSHIIELLKQDFDIMKASLKSISIPLTDVQGLAMIEYKHRNKELRRMFDKVKISFKKLPQAIKLESISSEIAKAHIKVAEILDECCGLFIMKLLVKNTVQIVGKKQKKINALEAKYSKTAFKVVHHPSSEHNWLVTVVGCRNSVDKVFQDFSQHGAQMVPKNFLILE